MFVVSPQQQPVADQSGLRNMVESQPSTLWPPASATYKISGWLGSGTFGAVFKARRRLAHDSPLDSRDSNVAGSEVAVKVIPRYAYESSRELEVMQVLREKPHMAVMQLIECFSVESTKGSAARILTCLVLPLYDSCHCKTKRRPARPAGAQPNRLIGRGWPVVA